MSGFFQSKIPIFRPRRSWQDLSHGNHLSSKMGKIVPFYCDRTEFGDKRRLSVIAAGRTMPLFTPVMDQLKTKFAWYEVTIRSIWDGWEDFITSGSKWSLDGELPPEIPQSTVARLIMECNASAERQGVRPAIDPMFWTGTMLDYLDFPYYVESGQSTSHVSHTLQCSVLPLIALGYIYNERFVNENIQAVLDLREVRHLKGDILSWSEVQRDSFFRWCNFLNLFDVNWNKDYLTAAQPYTQKGRDVVLPLNVTLPDQLSAKVSSDSLRGMVYIGEGGKVSYGTPIVTPHGLQWHDVQTGDRIDPASVMVLGTPRGGTLNSAVSDGVELATKYPTSVEIDGSLPYGELLLNFRTSQGQPVNLAAGMTVNELRYLSSVQRVLEMQAVGGTRYVELALHQYGIRISDKTAQRPVFHGGSSIPIKIGEVVQTSATTGSGADESVLGRFGGTGYQRGGAAAVKVYSEEPSILLGLMWTKPQTSYMWGVPRHLAELDVFDIMNPNFAHLGEQEVFNYEAMRDTEDPRGVFGYLMRYDHLRTKLSRVHGEMRVSLTDWHMARNNVRVALNNDFIKASPTTRIFNVTDNTEDTLVHQIWINEEVKRSIPKRANPLLK